jgi:hypothetical protein
MQFMVNYDSLPGQIRPDLALAEGFNGKIFLKGTIHELGHAFGLPHLGPDISLGLGNSLMGPTTAAYEGRKGPQPEKVYLGDAAAAMLWKHRVFTGVTTNAFALPRVKLEDYKAAFDRASKTITVSGKLVTDQPAHSVVLIDDQGKPNDEYWRQSHAVRIDPSGGFRIPIARPPHVSGHYQILFCFDNGNASVTADCGWISG